MTAKTIEAPPTAELPFEPRTLARRLLGHRKIGLAAVVAGTLSGLVGAVIFGDREYETDTVLLYRPRPAAMVGSHYLEDDSLSLTTQMHLVKVRTNLATVRQRLGLNATLAQIGAAVDVAVTDKSNLLIITARWSSPGGAARLADTMRHVYLRQQQALRFRRELNALDRLIETAALSLTGIERQITNLDRLRIQLSAQVREERASSPETEGLAEINIRIERLRRAIVDDQTARANVAKLTASEGELTRAKRLRAVGGISTAQYERILAEHDGQRALTVDTDQVQEWRAELERLQETVIPRNAPATQTTPIIREVMLQAVQTEIDRVGVADRIAQLRQRRDETSKLMAALDSGEAHPERAATSDFRIVTEARIPGIPTKSNRKMLAVAIAIVTATLIVAAVVVLAMLDPTIRSGAELAHRTGLTTLAPVPAEEEGETVPASLTPSLIENYRLCGRRLRRCVPDQGVRVLVTSAGEKEGKTTVTLNLAAVLGSDGDRVLVIDATAGPQTLQPAPTEACVATERPRWRPLWGRHRVEVAGAKRTDGRRTVHTVATNTSLPTQEPEPAPWTTGSDLANHVLRSRLPNVDVLPSTRGVILPIQAPQHLRTLLEQAAAQYDIVLVDGPPVLSCADGETWAQLMDGVVVVVRATATKCSPVRLCMTRLAATETRILGAVLNAAPSAFLDLE